MPSRVTVSQRDLEVAIWGHLRNTLAAHTFEELLDQLAIPLVTERDEENLSNAAERVANQLDRKAAGK